MSTNDNPHIGSSLRSLFEELGDETEFDLMTRKKVIADEHTTTLSASKQKLDALMEWCDSEPSDDEIQTTIDYMIGDTGKLITRDEAMKIIRETKNNNKDMYIYLYFSGQL